MKKYILLLTIFLICGASNAQTDNKPKEYLTMEDLIEIQKEGDYSCVILNGDKPRTFNQRGVADLYNLVNNEPELLKGASMVDKVVGKGAASLMITGGIVRLHTGIICTPALEMLRKEGVEVTFDKEVEFIYNRSRTDWCPLEKRCKNAETAQECIPIIESFIKSLNKTNTN